MTKFLSITLIALVLISCSEKDGDIQPDTDITKLNNSINDFVWKAMNDWYYWQNDIPNLADTKDNDQNSYHKYLNTHDQPIDLFNSVLNTPTDIFSLFIDNYNIAQKSLNSANTIRSFGFKYDLIQLDANNILMYINFIYNDSPAQLAGFKRGDLINMIDGNTITFNNYITLLEQLEEQETIQFSFTEKDGTTTKDHKTIDKASISDNPVHLTKIFDDVNGKKVGYLVYNEFNLAYHNELNSAFAEFKSAGINELILDLRINGGGAVLTSSYLASMIYGDASSNETYAELKFNSKRPNSDITTFANKLALFDNQENEIGEEQINRLSGITKLYVLTSINTASASELIINGLRPFIDVVVIGDKTFGKDVASLILYDSPASNYTDKSTANSDHNNALQLIIAKAYNNLGESNYSNGFEPDIEVLEWEYLSSGLFPIGDDNEILLKTALDDIRGISAKTFVNTNNFIKPITVKEKPSTKDMYITAFDLNSK